MDSGFPTKSASFFNGQDVLYGQFNDIDFYVEDEDQENFYLATLKKLFPDIRIEKIFPLCGKPNVLPAARLTTANKKKVYILDKDFDDILNIKEALPNLFYLQQYSIENYLLETDAIQNLLIEEKPKIKSSDFAATFSLTTFQKETRNLFKEIISSFLVIQKHSLGIKNVKNDVARFCNLNHPPSLKVADFNAYKVSIDAALKLKNKRLSVSGQIKVFKKYFSNKVNLLSAIKHIPGKYILQFLKAKLRQLFDATSFTNMTLESLSIRLANKCEFKSLAYLQADIVNFIS